MTATVQLESWVLSGWPMWPGTPFLTPSGQTGPDYVCKLQNSHFGLTISVCGIPYICVAAHIKQYFDLSLSTTVDVQQNRAKPGLLHPVLALLTVTKVCSLFQGGESGSTAVSGLSIRLSWGLVSFLFELQQHKWEDKSCFFLCGRSCYLFSFHGFCLTASCASGAPWPGAWLVRVRVPVLQIVG